MQVDSTSSGRGSEADRSKHNSVSFGEHSIGLREEAACGRTSAFDNRGTQSLKQVACIPQARPRSGAATCCAGEDDWVLVEDGIAIGASWQGSLTVCVKRHSVARLMWAHVG